MRSGVRSNVANRTLTPEELAKANELLALIRERLETLSDGDRALLFAYRRKISKELTYDERSKPKERMRLKKLKREEQGELCPICLMKLPDRYNVLDRLQAVDGYTPENTRLICNECDKKVQRERRYA